MAMGEPDSDCHQTSSFGDDRILGQGLPPSWTLEEFRRRVQGLLDTYLGSKDLDEAISCFNEFAQETAEFLDEVVVYAVRIALERTSQQRDMIASLLQSLLHKGVLNESSLVRGFAKLICMWEDLVLDSGPRAAAALVQVLLSCMKEGCIERAFLTKLPEGLLVAAIQDGTAKDDLPELQEVVRKMQEFKQALEEGKLLNPHTYSTSKALSAKGDRLSKKLRKLAMPTYHHEYVKRVLVASFDWPPAERSNCIVLLAQLHADGTLASEDIQWGAIRLLSQLDDLTLDCPETSELSAEHLAALTAANLLSASFLLRCQLLRVGGASGLAVMGAAQQETVIEKVAHASATAAAVEESDEEEQEDEDDDVGVQQAEETETAEQPLDAAQAADTTVATQEESVEVAAADAMSVPSVQEGGLLTRGLSGGVSLRPGGDGSLRPGGSLSGGLTGSASLRPGGGLSGSLTGGASLRPGGGLTGGLTGPGGSKAGQDKRGSDQKAGGGKAVQRSEDGSNSWRDDAAKTLEKKQKRSKQQDGQSASSASGQVRRGKRADDEKPPKLVASDTSWAAQQLKRRQEENVTEQLGNEEVTRRVKSILNKLTFEKFDDLYKQLVSCGISNEEHVRIVIAEVFEKATTQHHFIGMYTLLCVNLNEWFSDHVKSGDFKKVLLGTCQASFEANLKPPEELQDKSGLGDQELDEKWFKHKMRMLGNIQLVGQLLLKKMVASKVLIAIGEELFSNGSPSAFETLANLLKIVGSEYDTPSFKFHKQLGDMFSRLQQLAKDKSLPPRTRYLLQDVLDLRGDRWVDKKRATQKMEGPKKLDELH